LQSEIFIKLLTRLPGKNRERGWVRNLRASNQFGFVELNDGTCFSNLQIVLEEDKLDNFKEVTKQNIGAALIVRES
jgi:asparaginyl-tRNA synthetase